MRRPLRDTRIESRGNRGLGDLNVCCPDKRKRQPFPSRLCHLHQHLIAARPPRAVINDDHAGQIGLRVIHDRFRVWEEWVKLWTAQRRLRRVPTAFADMPTHDIITF